MGNAFLKRSLWFILMVSVFFVSSAFAERFEVRKTIDAVVEWDTGKAYFFKGSQYVRYDIKADRVDPGYPKPINNETWPGIPWTDGIDTAVNWGNGKAYFFRGSQYVRYDIKADKADPGYPKPINNETWPGIPWMDGIDSAVNWRNNKAYFFKGSQYVRYDIKADRVDPGYPKSINNENWPGIPWMDGIDSAVNWRNNKAYFFKGDSYIRFDIKADRADPGYPKPINNETWPGISALLR
jgi:hypothetical protein